MTWKKPEFTAADGTTQTLKPRWGLGGWMPHGVFGRLLKLIPSTTGPLPRLQILERIALAPRHTLALVESEGRRFLVATSPEGAPVFHPLDDRIPRNEQAGPGLRRGIPGTPVARPSMRRAPQSSGRVSW